MRLLKIVVPSLLVAGLLSGCFGYVWRGATMAGSPLPVTPVMPPPGFLFEEVQAPLSYDFHATAAKPAKTGEAVSHFIGIPFYPLLSVAFRDQASMENAAINGGLSEVAYADYEIFNVLGVYSRFTVIAYGE